MPDSDIGSGKARDGSPPIAFGASRIPAWSGVPKRAFDVVGGALALVLFSPFLILAGLGIKLADGGPMLFVQARTGRHGRRFRAFKFRTMSTGRSPDPDEVITADHADVTRLGRILRRFRIDELPQLVNVLRGEMSFVGPRPTLPQQTDAYDDFARQRLLVRPGLTGLAQVNGNASIPWEERIRYDVYYVYHQGPWLDLTILLKTVGVIVLGERRFARPFEASGLGGWNGRRHDVTVVAKQVGE